MLSAAMAYEAPARGDGAPAVAEDSRDGVSVPMLAKVPALEHAPAPGIMSTPHTDDVASALASKSPAPLLAAEVAGSDGSLRASLARMMAAEHRWPAPTLASYAPNLSGAPRPLPEIRSSTFCPPLPPFQRRALSVLRHGSRRVRSWRRRAARERRARGAVHLACAEHRVGGMPTASGGFSAARDDACRVDSARDRPRRAQGVRQRPAKRRRGRR